MSLKYWFQCSLKVYFFPPPVERQNSKKIQPNEQQQKKRCGAEWYNKKKKKDLFNIFRVKVCHHVDPSSWENLPRSRKRHVWKICVTWRWWCQGSAGNMSAIIHALYSHMFYESRDNRKSLREEQISTCEK